MLAALLALPLALAAPIDISDPHPPMVIEGDGAFTTSNGVRSGSGSAEDPYVIADWTIVQADRSAVRLAGTRAHVVIERVHVPWPANPGVCTNTPPGLLCAPLPLGSIGIELQDAQNVTIRATRLETDAGVVARNASRIAIEDLSFGDPRGLEVGIAAVHLDNASDIRISRLVPEGALSSITLKRASRVLVEDSTFASTSRSAFGEPASVVWLDADNVTIRETTFLGSVIDGAGVVRAVDVTIEDSRFLGVRPQPLPRAIFFEGARAIPIDRWTFCGNEFAGYDEALVDFAGGPSSIQFKGNSFHDANGSVRVLSGGKFADNRFELLGTPSRAGVILGAGPWPHEGRGNAFVALPRGVVAPGSADLSLNWWGDASGPSGAGEGTGTRLLGTGGSTAVFEPWLESAPALDATCRE